MSKNLSDIFPLSANSSGGGMVVSATEPAEKVDGMMWLDSTTARVWIWDEDKWLEFPAGGAPAVHVGNTAPTNPVEGQQWLNTDDGYLYVYYNNAGNPTWMAVERQS